MLEDMKEEEEEVLDEPTLANDDATPTEGIISVQLGAIIKEEAFDTSLDQVVEEWQNDKAHTENARRS